jgi:hypothetical protein
LLKRLEMCTDLGHGARTQAFLRQVRLALSAPAAGPSSWNDLVSFYRFAGNEQVDIDQLRQARRRLVVQSLPVGKEIVVVHDPTSLNYTGHGSKSDRRAVGNKGKGYEYVPVLAVDPSSRSVLGVLHDTVVNHEGPDDTGEMDYDYEPLFAGVCAKQNKRLRENHRHQMAVHVQGLAPHLSHVRAIHVADREFDDIYILLSAIDSGSDLLVRATTQRNVQIPEASWIPPQARTPKQRGHATPEGWTCVNLKPLVGAIACEPYKEAALDAHERIAPDSGAAARTARLEIGSCPVRLYRAARRNKTYHLPSRPVEVNLVVVREIDPPPGSKGLCWILLTTLPVDTHAQRIHVAYLYELRWMIEVFIRLLKSGYGIEYSRLDNAAKIGRLLVVLTIAALGLMRLKSAVGLGPGGKLDDATYQKAKQAMNNPQAAQLTPEWMLLGLVLRYGGWLGRRGDPIGPKILMRGTLMTLAFLDAIEQYGGLLLNLSKNKEAIRHVFRV